MKNDYPHIIAKIRSTPWLIMPESLAMILDIVDSRISGDRLSDDEIRIRLEAAGNGANDNRTEAGGGVGILHIDGPIFPKANLMTMLSGATSIEEFRADFRGMLQNDMIESVVLDIDSPGGMADLIPEMAREIRDGKEVKPVYAVANTLAASAAYYLASQATQVFVTPSGSVGSIGVYTVHEDVSRQEENAGRKHTFISAGKFKTEGNKYQELTPEAKSHVQAIVDNIYDQFVEDVALGRDISKEEVLANYGQGRVFDAGMAKSAGMVDDVATLDDVIVSCLDQHKQNRAFNVPVGVAATSALSGQRTRVKLEVAEKEHSEPGSGSGGEPQPRETPLEKDTKEGWRRDSPPITKEIEEGSIVDRAQLVALAKKLGVNDVDGLSDEQLTAKVTEATDAMVAEVTPLRAAAASAQKQRSFRDSFPDEYERMQRLEAADQNNAALAFSESYENFTSTATPGKNFMFASVTLDHIKDSHKKISTGEFTVDDLKTVLDSVANTGLIELGERGSSRSSESRVDVVGNTAGGKLAFVQRVEELMESDNLEYDKAIALAAQKFPEDFAEYRSLVPTKKESTPA